MVSFSCCSKDDTKKAKPVADVKETKTAAQRKVAWEQVRARLPRAKTEEDKKRRKDLFKQFDKDNSKSLTLDETYQGCIDILHLDEFTSRLKPITRRAFNKAKGAGTQDRGAGEDDKVEFLEFRLMLCYIYDYFELTVMFDEIDTDGSMMLDKKEFKEAQPMLEKWGVKVADPEKTFNQIDENKSGKMTFDEFANWAVTTRLDADGDPDNLNGAAPAAAVARELPAAETKTAAERKVAWESIRARLPRAKTAEDKKRRKDLFKQFDKDNSKSLTFEETYQGCIDILHLDEFTNRLKDITKRAFNKAKGAGTQDRGAGEDDKVEFLEFRLMLCYIYDYFELTVMFDEIDTDGSMMLDKKEFKEAQPMLEKWGVKITDCDKTFDQIDDNKSGKMTFDEFANWAVCTRLDADGDPDNLNKAGAAPVVAASAAAPAAAAAREIPADDKTAAERKAAWEKIRARIPRSKTAEDKKRRKELFKQFDKDGSKSLTFEETYQGCIDILHLDEFTKRLKDITKRAFNKAKGLGTDDRGAGEDDKVEFLEFRLMLCYIYDYFELTVMFDEMDADGSMTLDRDEFKAAVPKLAKWGVKIENYKKTFKEIDDNNSGKVTFDEFAAWASAARLDADGDPDNIH